MTEERPREGGGPIRASNPAAAPRAAESRRRTSRKGQKGQESIEFVLVLIPMLAMIFILLDTGWAVFAKGTMQRAVQVAVHSGVQMTASQLPPGTCLTQWVKSTVQQNALGLLSSTAGLNSIKVNYLLPPAPNSSGPLTDVSGQSTGNAAGNIMQVSVQAYSLVPLLPHMFGSGQPVDNNPLIVSVYAADLIESTQDTPCIGTAP